MLDLLHALIAIGVLVIGGSALGLTLALLRWAVLVLVPRMPPGSAVLAAIAGQVVPALERGHPEHHAVFAAAAQVRRPWSRRIIRAVRAADAGGGCLADHLEAARALPRHLTAQARAAAAAGPAALLAWWRTAAQSGPRDGSGAWAGWLVLATAISCMVYSVMHYIAPKMAMICRDLDIAYDPHLVIAAFPAAIAVALIALASWWCAARLDQPGRRGTAGRILLDALIARRDLASIIPVLAPLLPRCGPRLEHAAQRGDTAGFARALGWRIDDAAGLARALEADDLRRAWRRRMAALGRDLAMPLLLAIPVAMTAMWVFGCLISILIRMEAP